MSATACRRLDPPEDDPAVRSVLDSAGPVLQLTSWQGQDRIVADTVLDPDGRYALLASFIHDDVVRARGVSTGPPEDVVDELMRLIPPCGNGTRHRGPDRPLPLTDFLLLRDLLQRDDQAGIDASLAAIGAAAVPNWVQDLAGATGGVRIGLAQVGISPLTTWCAAAVGAGWVRVVAAASGEIRGIHLAPDATREHLVDLSVQLMRACAS